MNLSTFGLTLVETLVPWVLTGTAITAMVAVFLKRANGLNAATRFAIWTGVFVLLIIAPCFTFRYTSTAPGTGQGAGTGTGQRLSTPRVASVAPAPAINAETPPIRPAGPLGEYKFLVPKGLGEVIVTIYLTIASASMLWLLISYCRLRRLRRRSDPAPVEVAERLSHWRVNCPTRRHLDLLVSDEVRSPMAVGFTKPAIILPRALLFELTEDKLDQIGIHELAHIRRYDDVSNLFQRLGQALFFFHPGVHWAARCMTLEREIACDDWVVRSVSEPESYARFLEQILRFGRSKQGPALATGAAFRKSQIFRRVEMLLSRTRNNATGLSSFTVFAALFIAAGILYQFANLPGIIALREGGSGSHMRARWTDDNRDLQIELYGEVTFSGDDRSIESMEPGAFFSVAEKRGWTRRKLEARSSTTRTPEFRYFVDGNEKTFDNAARGWLSSLLPNVIREAGLDLPARVRRIHASRGTRGVLDEVRAIRSDSVKVHYLQEFVGLQGLSQDDLSRAMATATRIGSDGDKARLLLELAQTYASDELRPIYFRTLDTIGSDSDRKHVLLELLQGGRVDKQMLELVGRSVEKIGSDSDKREVLEAIARTGAAHSSDSGTVVLKAAGTIQSDSDRTSVLLDLLSKPGLEEAELPRVASAAKHLSSDHDKARVLSTLAPKYNGIEFFDALNSIQSDNDRKQVLTKLIESKPEPAVVLRIVESAQRISSDSDKVEVLTAVAQRYQDPDVRTALQRAGASVQSDSDYRRLASILLKAAE